MRLPRGKMLIDNLPLPAYIVRDGEIHRNDLQREVYGERLPHHEEEVYHNGTWYLTVVYPHEGGVLGMSTPVTLLKDRERVLRHLAVTDGLTGLLNRRAFDTALVEANAQLSRYGTHYCLVLIDMDGLKQINDTRGHDAGDRAIVDIARVLAGCIRRTDKAYRFGGDEYALILHHTDEEGGERVADRIRDDAMGAGYSVSVGVAGGGADVYKRADQKLYQDKARSHRASG